MPKTLTRYYTCEFLKSLLDPSLHKYVDAPKRLVKPAIYLARIKDLEKKEMGLNDHIKLLQYRLSLEEKRSMDYLNNWQNSLSNPDQREKVKLDHFNRKAYENFDMRVELDMPCQP